MMRFMHSHRSGSPLARVVPGGAAILIAALASGCSAEITRFDFPGFSLTDDKKDTTSSLQQTASADRGPSYLGNERNSSASRGHERGGYVAPRSYGESGVEMANLPETSSPPPTYSYADDRRRAAQSQRPAAPALRPGESVEIRPGDTLYGLSRRHQVSVAALMEVNGLNNPNLHPGQKIYLPEGYSAQPRRVAAAQAPISVAPPSDSSYDGSYTMRSGDSLYGISRSYGVPLRELQRANGITDPRGVRVGTVLRVPRTSGGTNVAPIAEPPTQVAEAPQVIQSTHQPTVINRRATQVAARTGDVSTGTINPPPRSASSGDTLRWPVHGKIITGFGQRNDGTHNDGINLAVPQGTSVHAAETGSVAYAGSELKGYGNLVLVRHDNGWVTAYAHNDELMVKRGDKVQRGQVIAKAGRTGSVDQPQLHFELRQGSKPVDPVPFLDRL
jgi:murein DD-endopeptidase MepM/ murein hydrolase activator NlpD